MHAERQRAGIAVRYACLVVFVILCAVPVYVFVEPPWRGLVARLASALVLGVALLELRNTLAQKLARHEASALDGARVHRMTEPGVPPRFLALAHEVRAAVRSRRYFEMVMWPRLLALSVRPLHRPPTRRPGRGPSLASLDDVVTAIEKQR